MAASERPFSLSVNKGKNAERWTAMTARSRGPNLCEALVSALLDLQESY